MDRIRRLMRRLPPSTDKWTCLWFVSIGATALAAGIAGLTAKSTLGLVVAAIAFVVLGVVLGMRRRDDYAEACHPYLSREDKE